MDLPFLCPLGPAQPPPSLTCLCRVHLHGGNRRLQGGLFPSKVEAEPLPAPVLGGLPDLGPPEASWEKSSLTVDNQNNPVPASTSVHLATGVPTASSQGHTLRSLQDRRRRCGTQGSMEEGQEPLEWTVWAGGQTRHTKKSEGLRSPGVPPGDVRPLGARKHGAGAGRPLSWAATRVPGGR